MKVKEFLKKFEMLEDANKHSEAIRVACEFFGDLVGASMMAKIIGLENQFGYVPAPLAELRGLVWERVMGQYYDCQEAA